MTSAAAKFGNGNLVKTVLTLAIAGGVIISGGYGMWISSNSTGIAVVAKNLGDHEDEGYHEGVVQIIDARVAIERSWNESRHDRSQDDRQRMSENQTRILQILADNKRRIEVLEQ